MAAPSETWASNTEGREGREGKIASQQTHVRCSCVYVCDQYVHYTIVQYGVNDTVLVILNDSHNKYTLNLKKKNKCGI